MSNVAVEKVGNTEQKTLPIFEEIRKRFDDVRQRALDLFEKRGRQIGHELDDWLKAEREILGGWPAAELKEKDGKYEFEMTLPGFEPKEVTITATPNEIIVHAETKHEKKTTEGTVLWTEFGSNNVYRRVELPEPIDVDKTDATLEKGLLRIGAAKAPAAKKTKTISIAA
jgi:HSP20 family molecular chaperone IbpA